MAVSYATVRYEDLNGNGYPKVSTATGEVLEGHPTVVVIEDEHGTTRVPWANVIDIYESRNQ
ncbi:hypothetical protein [Gordonia soli]|uniref:Uncharacterized protein n=1 Tax=Gordonia soli NBRC 108243 TaxID=1223545 RepID=M0QR41_9ACTN|nr:hypothetical protein [Gordonia soli]GAC71078.1 hypothetical protein GS4_51_00160 [Gordonia soli NBRC 108243]